MHRQHLLHLLDAYDPFHPEEIQYKHDMLHFVKNNARCFERSLETGHMTASSWLVSQDGSQALLMHHTKLNRWLQLGGHADGHSNLLEVAKKEAREESGITHIEAIAAEIFDIDIHLIPENLKEKAHYHYDVRFLLQVKSFERVQGNHESKELLWISKDPSGLPTKETSIVRMFTKWIKRSNVFL